MIGSFVPVRRPAARLQLAEQSMAHRRSDAGDQRRCEPVEIAAVAGQPMHAEHGMAAFRTAPCAVGNAMETLGAEAEETVGRHDPGGSLRRSASNAAAEISGLAFSRGVSSMAISPGAPDARHGGFPNDDCRPQLLPACDKPFARRLRRPAEMRRACHALIGAGETAAIRCCCWVMPQAPMPGRGPEDALDAP